MKIICSVSGGLSSAYTLDQCIQQYGHENVIALFADVKGTGYSHWWSDFPEVEYLLHERFGGESRDLYRFLWQVSNALDHPIERLEDGRSIWGVAADTKAFLLKLPNGLAVCKASEYLKRITIASWVKDRFKADEYRMALGMRWDEAHRVNYARQWWSGYMDYDVDVFSPMLELATSQKTFIDECALSLWAHDKGLDISSAYKNNLEHDNCNAVCFHAGISQYAWVYEFDRLAFDYAAYQERNLRRKGIINATILKDQRGQEVKPLTLDRLAERLEAGDVIKRKLGGMCQCFIHPPMAQFLKDAEVA